MTEPYSYDVAARILEEVKKANTILLHCHPVADADSVGSALGMKYILESMGKSATVIKGDTNIPRYLSALPGVETIVQKNYFEVDLTHYDLFLILDSAAIDRVSTLQPVTFPDHLSTIVIDHHKSNPGYASINLVDDRYPATAQIVYELAKAWGASFTHDAALNLFAGMYSDTGGFKYKPASGATLHAAAELADIAPDFTDMLFEFHNNNTPERLKAQGVLLSSIKTYLDNTVAIAGLSYDDIQKTGLSEDDIAGTGIADFLKSVKGWNIGVSLVERTQGSVKASLRSRDPIKYDVSKVALALGGGGHAAAAGATIQGTIQEASEKIAAAIEQSLGK